MLAKTTLDWWRERVEKLAVLTCHLCRNEDFFDQQLVPLLTLESRDDVFPVNVAPPSPTRTGDIFGCYTSPIHICIFNLMIVTLTHIFLAFHHTISVYWKRTSLTARNESNSHKVLRR